MTQIVFHGEAGGHSVYGSIHHGKRTNDKRYLLQIGGAGE